jgi:hypothetical protein
VSISRFRTVEEGRRSKMTEDTEDGSITTSRDSYAQSECRVHCKRSTIMYITYPHQKPCLTVFLFQENKSFGASYHLHSSSDVREVVSRTDSLFKCFSQVLDTFLKGFACVLYS